ncbi:helix-turn-helix domain-containing protein [Tropicimonas sp. IMCC34043]|uniref:helix-turn-helix domain-containing protein n=1 Tax=Tropicimonas sp. IMCC34043 TaxID=2248760 RepID=UPI000E276B18|nr:helix-turn-helix transcriptional regulator [Tropicimonas sp. IMCC34043]
MNIGEVISRARRAAGLKQKELAEAAGVHVQTLKRLEGGAGAGYSTVRALERALGKAGASWQEVEGGYCLTVLLRVRDPKGVKAAKPGKDSGAADLATDPEPPEDAAERA